MVFELLHVVACRLEPMHKDKRMTGLPVPCKLLQKIVVVVVDFFDYYWLCCWFLWLDHVYLHRFLMAE